MKNIFFVFVVVVCFLGCAGEEASGKKVEEIKGGEVAEFIRNPVSAVEEVDPEFIARMAFESKEFKFGTVKEGTKVKHTFKFKNSGRVPLLITDARSTCGCTVPSYPEDPIKPGEEGTIDVVFDTHNKPGNQHKVVTVIANTYPRENRIHLRGIVK